MPRLSIWKKRMFGFSDGIDHSQFMAVVMVTESWRKWRGATAWRRLHALSDRAHLGSIPSGGISGRTRACSVARDGSDRTSFSGTRPGTTAVSCDADVAKPL
jgi:hypothetical protein